MTQCGILRYELRLACMTYFVRTRHHVIMPQKHLRSLAADCQGRCCPEHVCDAPTLIAERFLNDTLPHHFSARNIHLQSTYSHVRPHRDTYKWLWLVCMKMLAKPGCRVPLESSHTRAKQRSGFEPRYAPNAPKPRTSSASLLEPRSASLRGSLKSKGKTWLNGEALSSVMGNPSRMARLPQV